MIYNDFLAVRPEVELDRADGDGGAPDPDPGSIVGPSTVRDRAENEMLPDAAAGERASQRGELKSRYDAVLRNGVGPKLIQK